MSPSITLMLRSCLTAVLKPWTANRKERLNVGWLGLLPGIIPYSLMRPAWGSQDSAFALGLPMGLMPSQQALTGGW